MRVSERVLNAALMTLTACVALITVAVVKREFIGNAAATPRNTYVKDWRHYAAEGQSTGPVDAPITITEFSDFQCPACRFLFTNLQEFREKYPISVRVVYRHFPLEGIHPHAFNAAVASECGATQGSFESLHHLLFEKQDSIGLISWNDFARRAGVADVHLFDTCMRESVPASRVNNDIEAGNRLAVRGTPTVLFNGLRLAAPPSVAKLDSLAQDVLRLAVRDH